MYILFRGLQSSSINAYEFQQRQKMLSYRSVKWRCGWHRNLSPCKEVSWVKSTVSLMSSMSGSHQHSFVAAQHLLWGWYLWELCRLRSLLEGSWSERMWPDRRLPSTSIAKYLIVFSIFQLDISIKQLDSRPTRRERKGLACLEYDFRSVAWRMIFDNIGPTIVKKIYLENQKWNSTTNSKMRVAHTYLI